MAGNIRPKILSFSLTYDSVRALKAGGLQTITEIQDAWESVKLHLTLSSNNQHPHRIPLFVLERESVCPWLTGSAEEAGVDLLGFHVLFTGLGSCKITWPSGPVSKPIF